MINTKGEKHGTITARINDKENFEVRWLCVGRQDFWEWVSGGNVVTREVNRIVDESAWCVKEWETVRC
jgi:hypothetical protein